jgi:hypothetical protein
VVTKLAPKLSPGIVEWGAQFGPFAEAQIKSITDEVGVFNLAVDRLPSPPEDVFGVDQGAMSPAIARLTIGAA